MTATIVETLPFEVPSPNALLMEKIKRFDPIEADGSLLLLDTRHFAAGVPADDSALPNVVEDIALDVLGSANPADVRPILNKPASFTGTAGKLERTTKGGLHGIVPQGGNAVNGGGPSIYLPRPLTKYMLDHYTHKFYLSVWLKITRLPVSNSVLLGGLALGAQQTNSCLIALVAATSSGGAIGARPASGDANAYVSALTADPATMPAAGNNLFLAHESKDYYQRGTNGVPTTPSPSVAAGTLAVSGIGWGYAENTNSGVGADGTTGIRGVTVPINKDQGASFVLYRMYAEDLTVSGRTKADVLAIDQALYTQHVKTSGGDFYGDTFTDPTTIP